jgi:hypothetical protein
MPDSILLQIALGLAAAAAAFGLAEWIAIARARRQRRIADAVLRWYLEDLERERSATMLGSRAAARPQAATEEGS